MKLIKSKKAIVLLASRHRSHLGCWRVRVLDDHGLGHGLGRASVDDDRRSLSIGALGERLYSGRTARRC